MTTSPRFVVNAMHKPSNGFDGPTQVDYWRVFDNATEMRADGTAKYETPERAQQYADALNQAWPLRLLDRSQPSRIPV